jgi:AcrR family transcriptional regulator
VLDAAIGLYAETGWAGFSFEAVARRASVGKASLYARWPTRAALLAQTLETRWLTVGRIDTGSLRGDLTALAHMLFDTSTSARGGTARWMAMDGSLYPEVSAVAAPYKEATVRQGRAIARRAIARGEVAASVNPGLLMDLLVGAVTNHTGTTPERLRAAMIAKKDAFIDALVRAVLLGVGAREAASGD